MPNTSDERPESPPESGATPKPGRRRSRLPVLILLVAVVAGVGVYGSGLFTRFLPLGLLGTQQDSEAVLGRASSENLFSQERLLARVGAGAVDETKSPTLGEQSLVSEIARKPASCPPLVTPPPREQSQALSSEDSESPARAPKPGARVANGPKAVETPVIVTREPEQADSKPTQKGADTSSIVGPADDSANQSAVRTGETRDSARTETKQDSGALKAAAVGNAAEAEDKAQFQLPGSLKVRIHDYSGDLPKWAVMVILDDSVSMTRKTKNWAAGKMQTAETVVSRIASALPPGSKLAVRDFTCGNSDEKKSKKAPCLSRMVYEWAESPYSGLKEKVGQTVAGGPTNPCAAAAYSLKKDFGSDHLIPRILVVTDGTAKCAFNEVVKALDQHKAKGKVGVDVVAVGMGKKRQAGYATLTKKTDGMLLKIERPGDLDAGVSRYVKALRTPMMEKVEVKGENSVFTMHPQEEITLPPGTYTVVLPVVVGLNPAKRIVPHVKINSGEANILDVRIRKGKPAIKLGKK